MRDIQASLANHAFEHLFIECLGWDRVRSIVSLDVNNGPVELTAIAQKRGFTVFVAPAHRTVLADRQLLRNLQRKLRKTHHEHILIHCCDIPCKQVWQWATTSGDGRRILHREHPFFSNDPPPRLLERLSELAVTFEEEEQTTLTDVLQKVRHALLPDSDLNLFAKRPEYAAKSDRLAVAMKQGDADAFSEFVEFHMPLARQASRMLVRWFDMDPDDAEQTAMIGLIEAARRFDPERGFQFSTYAGYWIRNACQRYGLEWGLQIRLPPHIFWRCYRLAFERTRLIATYGERDAQAEFETFRNSEGISAKEWSSFWTACHVDFLAELEKEQTDRLDVTYDFSAFEDAASDELCDGLQECLKFLPVRQAEVLRLRYGIGEREHTLQEVADHLGITRERVRQIQVKAEEKLERRVAGMGFGERPAPAIADSANIEIEESTL